MQKKFEVIKLDNEPYDFLIIATSVINPLSHLDDVIIETGQKKARFIFDLTLINGTNSNRYIKGECTGGIFVSSSFKCVNKLDNQIKKVCDSFFSNNGQIVQNSVVTNQLKYLIKNGMV